MANKTIYITNPAFGNGIRITGQSNKLIRALDRQFKPVGARTYTSEASQQINSELNIQIDENLLDQVHVIDSNQAGYAGIAQAAIAAAYDPTNTTIIAPPPVAESDEDTASVVHHRAMVEELKKTGADVHMSVESYVRSITHRHLTVK